MLKTQKILSVLLSLIMLFGTFSLAAFAESTTISAISIDVNIEAGMTLNDFEEFLTISEGLEPVYGDGIEPVLAVYCENGESLGYDDVFENDIPYDIYFYFKPSEGYALDDSIKYVTVNGKKTDDFYIDVSDDFGDINICLDDFVINAEPFTGTYIEKAEITINSDIAGIDADDYEDYITILTNSLEFEDNYGDPAVFVYNRSGDEFNGKFKSGETYYLYVYLSAKESYALSGYVEGYVNGEEAYSYVAYWTPDDETVVEYVELEYELTVEGEKEFNIFERIINFFRNLFEKFLDFFRIHPMPI